MNRLSGVWRSVFLALLTAGVVGSAAWLVFFSSVLGVRDIRVVGNLTVPAQQIQQATGVTEGKPLATVDVDEVAGRVKKLRQVESAVVSRGWPGTLLVEIVEREPVAVMPVGTKAALIDRHGVVTEIKDIAPPSLPVLRVDRPQPGDPTIGAALAVIDALPEDLARRVAEVVATSPEAVSLRLKDGRAIVWGGRDRSAAKARIIATLLKRPADTYDVSSPDVVTVK
ncbi:cell division protein FtsQ/DivIB [Streptosporangium sp. NPDC000396]|uniref:cell division protein FtsQ/DivIB n=1 Tax=Streptosporangium sp. NPDC000396 TaxID=3366185 RepID=UPI00367F61D9